MINIPSLLNHDMYYESICIFNLKMYQYNYGIVKVKGYWAIKWNIKFSHCTKNNGGL